MATKKWIQAGVLLLTAASLSACGASNDGKTKEPEAGKAAEAPKEPVTLTFYDPSAKQDPAIFMEQYGDFIQKKYPHITVKYISSPDTNPEGHIANMLAAGEPIDIMLNADINHYRLIAPFKFEYDLTGLAKSRGFDLSKLEPGTLKAVQALSNNNGLYAIPYKMQAMGLLYNKDLFDKFGRPYPKDGMTWDEVYEVAKTMTRSDSGVQYRGFITQFYNTAWLNQLSLGFVDPKTEKSVLNSDERWARLVKNLTRFYEIPGNETKEGSFGTISNLFLKDRVAAMYAYFIPTTPQEVNWDVVTYPEFSDRRGVGPQQLLTLAYVTSTSKHKEAAFDAVAYLASDEVQTNMSRKALAFPVTTSQAAKDAFGQDTPFLQGKNVRALLKSKPADPFPSSPYQRTAALPLEKTMYELTKGAMDVNTALRKMAEDGDKDIEKAKAAAAASK
ncbi:ABC transporter substrate-binding protein [Paenibacillus ginsengarvi]|uniref:Extracellular solute-binding protein n=1 Tax=Paenibacillus ginsengarvi TaxID=400777 RepID=A0A3B0CLB4_9BACL|nr:extracellular solute-binding protein [Paenibacillus ginsengarvi]RKN85548.1 extracellular solute-binding protein [Paenibacillus ginsengarvi]